jgi:hypothetical protein
MRILFNSAQILISHLQQNGYDAALADEAMAVLMHVDAIAPGQQRFAQLMEQLAQLAPMRAWWPRRRPASTRRRTAPCRNDAGAQQRCRCACPRQVK